MQKITILFSITLILFTMTNMLAMKEEQRTYVIVLQEQNRNYPELPYGLHDSCKIPYLDGTWHSLNQYYLEKNLHKAVEANKGAKILLYASGDNAPLALHYVAQNPDKISRVILTNCKYSERYPFYGFPSKPQKTSILFVDALEKDTITDTEVFYIAANGAKHPHCLPRVDWLQKKRTTVTFNELLDSKNHPTDTRAVQTFGNYLKKENRQWWLYTVISPTFLAIIAYLLINKTNAGEKILNQISFRK